MDIPWDQSGSATPQRDEALIPWVGERGIDARMGSVRPSDATANWRVAWSGLHGSLETLAAGESPTTPATTDASIGSGTACVIRKREISAVGFVCTSSASGSCAGSQEEKTPPGSGAQR